jgi:DNA polymerase-1
MTSSAPINSENDIYLVDGSGFIFRAYFAMPQNLTNPEGTPVGAVLGFCNMIQKLIQDLQAPSIAVIFDASRHNFRYDIYENYKANREEAPEDLRPQFPLFRKASEAFGLPTIELEGFEADDLIATYTRIALESGRAVTIVGTDKDLMQLVRPGVRLYDPIKNKYLGADEVIEKFGVPPEKVIDVQALAGDTADNIPGVPGIGIKTAAQLIEEFGSLEDLLAQVDNIKQPKRRQSLIDNAELARISKQLVTLDTHVDVPVPLDDLAVKTPDTEKLSAFLSSQGFKNLITRLGLTSADQGAVDNHASIAKAPQAPRSFGAMSSSHAASTDGSTSHFAQAQQFPPISQNQYVMINDEATLKEWVAQAYDKGLLAIDSETTNLTPRAAECVGISLCITPGQAAYIPLAHKQVRDLLDINNNHVEQLSKDIVIKHLKPLLEDKSVLKIAHNAKYDWQIFKSLGIEMTPCDDTMLMSYVLDGTSHGNGMDELASLFLGHQTIAYTDVAGKGAKQVTFDYVDIAKATDYAAEDADITLRLYHILKPRLVAEKMMAVYEDIERPLIPIIAQMEYDGIAVDPKVLDELSQDFGTRLTTLEREIFEIAGHEFNIASPKQLGVVLFEELGLTGGSKTKTGDWSTSAAVLEDLAGNAIVDKVLEYRQFAKLKSTYSDALQEQINPITKRVHTSYHLTGTSTGRLSSTDPNLQNIPIRTEEGRKIRAAFVATEGHELLSVDYSQVELRLAAELAGIKGLQDAFRDGIDIHSLTASQVFDVPLAEVTSTHRRAAKAVNFGIIYGISGWGLAKSLDTTPAEANEFIRRYLNRFRELQDFMEAKKEEARANGFVTTLYGRKCMIPNINAKMAGLRNGAERQAINAPLQGTAADIMKKAMARIPRALKENGLSGRMLLQVHDELIFEVPQDELEQTTNLVVSIMESTANTNVPLIAEAGHAHNWSDAH